MPDIDRSRPEGKYTETHEHVCPNCDRVYTCACVAQPDKQSLVCRDCETATYNPVVHGGHGEKSEA